MQRSAVLICALGACLAATPALAQQPPPPTPVPAQPPPSRQPSPDFTPPPAEPGPGGAEPEPQGLPPRPEDQPAPTADAVRAASAAEDWWTHGQGAPPAAKDPLYGRRVSRQDLARAPRVSSNAEPLLYRLWGLQPLQIQHLRRGELILELWLHPQKTVRQAVIRITLRDDGRGFVQARAGLGCCSPEIGRRVDIDQELPAGYVALFRRLADDPAWKQPENVDVDYGGGAVDALCVGGVSYDLVLVQADRAVHLRRACAGAELGSVADILSATIGAALGKDPRFDILFPRGADFSDDKRAYDDLIRTGGRLKPRTGR